MRGKFALLLLLCLCAVPAHAQFKASMQGTVMDAQSNAIADAKVTITDQATQLTYNAVTNDQGFYRVNELPPGNYTVDVEVGGFKKSTSKDVVVEAEQPRGFDISLQVGATSDVVTVSASEVGLQTEDASVTGTLTSQEVLTLPQFGRDPYELLRLTPGVFGDASRQNNGNSFVLPQQPTTPGGSNNEIFQAENQVQIAANGQRVTANNYSLDGASVDSLSNGGAAVITPNQESIQEIVVTSSSYDAAQGRNSGAQVETVSKGGTNEFHGSALIHFNDKGLNAFNKFYGANNVPLSPIKCEGGAFTIVAQHCPSRNDQKYRDFAGSFGGPIIHNKLFFFFSYEGLRLSNTVITRSAHLESPAFAKYVQQAEPNSIAAKIFATPGIAPRIATTVTETDCCSLITNPSDPNYHPLGQWYQPGTAVGQAIGNGPDGIPDWGVYDLRVPNSSSGNQYNGRVDYTVGANRIFASTYITRLDNLNGGNRPIEDVALQPTNYVGTLGWTHTITSSLLNEVRFNFTRFAFDQTTPSSNTNYGIPQIELFDFDIGGFGNAGTGGNLLGITQAGTTPGKLAENTFDFRDTVNWIRGNHGLKFGVDIAREQNNDDEPGFERPKYQFRGLLNFANDACCFFESVAVDPNTGGLPNGQRYFRSAAYSLFAQDSWKFRPNLTLTLGLRWEYFPPITETQHLMSNYLFGSQGFVNGGVHPVTQLYNADKTNFGPRIGFAWSPSDVPFTHQDVRNRLVIRGGFGILYNRPFESEFTNIRQDTPYFAQASPCCFFDPGRITGPPPGSGIQYGIGSSTLATSFAPNPNFSFGVAPDGALCANAGCSQITKVDIFAAPQYEPTPYVYVYSLQTQLQVVKNWQLTVGYQGSRSRKLVRTIDLNRFRPGDTFDNNIDGVQSASADGVPCGPSNPACPAPFQVGNPRFNRVFFPLPDVNASFDALITQVTHQFSRGFTVSALYTYSHTIDTASNEIGYQQTDPFTQALDRASSDLDVRHHFQLSAFWELPLFRGRHDFLGAVVGGWTLGGILDKHSGFAFSALVGSCNPSADRNGDSYCPDLPFAYKGGVIANPSKQQWENGIFPNPANNFAAEFDTKTRGPACRCRNIFTGPGYTSLDLSFGKNFNLPENRWLGNAAKLEIRSNFFNALNILNLEPLAPATAPTDIINSRQFARPLDALSGRVIEFQARFSF